MKISRSQQKLENKGFILGLLASVVLHAVVISGAYFYKPKSKEITPINITKIDLGFFEVGGGVNDAPPSDEISEILEQNIIEELKEESIEEEVIQEEAVEEVIEEETIEEITEITSSEISESLEEIFKEKPKEEAIIEKPKETPKLVKKPEVKKETKKPEPKKATKKEPKKVAQKPASGQNAYNPNSNKVASSAITSENTMQTLSASQKANIGAQIQAIIAKEAQKNYPRNARRLNQQGTSVIEFTYHPSGSVTNLRVSKSSGYKSLDETVLKVIENVKSKFPKISAKTTFTVPIKFTLK